MDTSLLHVEYAERGNEYRILFIFSLLCEYVSLAYVRINVIYRVHQAVYVIRFLVVMPQKKNASLSSIRRPSP